MNQTTKSMMYMISVTVLEDHYGWLNDEHIATAQNLIKAQAQGRHVGDTAQGRHVGDTAQDRHVGDAAIGRYVGYPAQGRHVGCTAGGVDMLETHCRRKTFWGHSRR